MCPESLELAECKGQLGILVGKAVEILGGLLKVLQRVSGLGRNWLDHFEHLGCGFAQIGRAFSREHLAIFCAPGTFGALGDVDRHVAEQSELHQEHARIAINSRAFVDLHIDTSFKFRSAIGWSGTGDGLGRTHCVGGCLRALVFFAGYGRKKLLDLSDLATGQHDRRALFNSGRVIKVNLVSHQGSKQPGRSQQNEHEGDHRDRGDHQQPGHDFISL
jgi:hypothetical protein